MSKKSSFQVHQELQILEITPSEGGSWEASLRMCSAETSIHHDNKPSRDVKVRIDCGEYLLRRHPKRSGHRVAYCH